MHEPDQSIESAKSQPESPTDHPIATGLSVVGGGVAGAAIGNAIAGKVGAAVGSMAGAIAGGMAGCAIAPALQSSIVEVTDELLQETKPSLGLGADAKEIELPDHYSWEELQALSQPGSAA